MRARFPRLARREVDAAPDDHSLARQRAPQERLVGGACGLLIAALSTHLGLGVVVLLAPLQNTLLMGFAGLLLGAGRARWLGMLGAAALLALALLVDCTPWAGAAVRGLTVQDRLVRSDAVVVLAADIFSDGTPTPQSQRRLQHAHDLLRSGWSARLVLTRFAQPKPSYAPFVREQLEREGIKAEIVEVGPIRITRDEAREVSILARERGWRRVILVTDRSHTRRASALFREAGLPVLCSPCPNPHYDPDHLSSPQQRRLAFRDWLYETVWHRAHFSLRLI